MKNIKLKIGQQFDVLDYVLTLFNVVGGKVQVRMDDEVGAKYIWQTEKEFFNMLNNIEKDNNIQFIKEKGNDNRFIVK